MNTRPRLPLQAAALLFSLSLFIGYLWSTQRQSGLPSLTELLPAEFLPEHDPQQESLTIITMGTNPDGTKRPIVLGTKSMGGTPVVRIQLTPEEKAEHAEMLKPYLNAEAASHSEGIITLAPEITEFEGFINYGKSIPPGSPTPLLMPGSKNISQPVFSTRKATSEPAPSPVMPGSKIGIFAPPLLSFDPSIHQRSLMSGSKSGRVYNFFSTLWHNSPAHRDTITDSNPTGQIHFIQPPYPEPSGQPLASPEKTTP